MSCICCSSVQNIPPRWKKFIRGKQNTVKKNKSIFKLQTQHVEGITQPKTSHKKTYADLNRNGIFFIILSLSHDCGNIIK